METRIKFKKSVLEALPTPPADQRVTYYDTETNGLTLRITGAGAKSFSVLRRVKGGKLERITLGKFPTLPLEEARKKAMEALSELAQGNSVAAQVRRKKAEVITLEEVFADYLETRKNLKPRTVKDMRSALDETCADWLKKPITKITPAMVERRHKERGQKSEARANLAMRYLRALFNFAQAKYTDDDAPILTINPVKRLSETRAWYRVDRRQTLIKSHELAPWFKAVMALPSPDIRDYLLFVLFTGVRREEALKLKWEQVDLPGHAVTILDPKNHLDLVLPLSDYLQDLLSQRKAVSISEYVFADSHGRRISNFRYAQASIEKASGVAFCIHDLRRTYATTAESLDIPAYALKRLLNHSTDADVTAGYIVSTPERLREPMQKITDYLLKAGGLKETAPVVDIFQRRAGA
ncbi:Integrase [Gammaproteobacteria bacterium]